MENTIPKDVKDSSNNSEGKITPTKDKDSSSSETKSNPGTLKTNSNSYLNVIQSNNILMSEDNFIGISGLIGAGKTTLAKALGKVLNLPVYYEPIIENEYLEDFYRDMKRYSFSFQIYLLNCRFRQHQQVLWNGTGGIQDRTLYEDSIFAKVLYEDGNMEEREYKTYLNLFKNMSNFMKKNTLIIHLDCKPEESLERIKRRARGCETGITLEYLNKLYKGYEDFIKEISKVIPVLRVNYSKFKTAEEMADIIKKEYESMQNVRKVDYEEA
jgi:deoxyadenosine kinase